jgi:hypothetical protein
MDPNIDRDRTEDEAARLRSLSRNTHGRVCPSCGSPTLSRRRLPRYLRPLRLLGIRLKAYHCAYCGTRSVTRERA